jgi:hypothetical protein
VTPMLTRALIALVAALTLSTPAWAQSSGLDAQIRAHAGASVVMGPGMGGITLGIDSRLGRLAYVDFGFFLSPGNPDVDHDWDEDPRDGFRLRHGVTLTPGLRVPHRQPEGFRWDVIVRGGPSVIWTQYDGPRQSGVGGDLYEIDTSIVVGPDLLLSKGPFGVKLTARVFVAKPFSRQVTGNVLTLLPQVTVEGMYQFQGIVRNRWKEFTKGR